MARAWTRSVRRVMMVARVYFAPVLGAGACLAPVLGAQPRAARGADAPMRGVAWTIVAPDAALAWYAVLAELRLPGPGAFAYVPVRAPAAGATDAALARRLADSRENEILHFVPLYHPSADRAALAASLRAAAASSPAPAPRASLLVGALAQAMAPERRARELPLLAAALERARADAPSDADRRDWQQALDSIFLPALAPWLAQERLDVGRLIVAPGIGAEGRLFAATPDRTDNLAAVGAFAEDGAREAPLLAFVRELCFPAVTRAARAAGLDGDDAALARRESLAAVRCGALLLDARLPSRSLAYRAFWLRRLAESDQAAHAAVPEGDAPLRAAFDRAFAPDPALAGPIDRALHAVRSSSPR